LPLPASERMNSLVIFYLEVSYITLLIFFILSFILLDTLIVHSFSEWNQKIIHILIPTISFTKRFYSNRIKKTALQIPISEIKDLSLCYEMKDFYITRSETFLQMSNEEKFHKLKEEYISYWEEFIYSRGLKPCSIEYMSDDKIVKIFLQWGKEYFISFLDLKEYYINSELHFFSLILINNESFSNQKGVTNICIFIVNYHVTQKVFHTWGETVLCDHAMNSSITNIINRYFYDNYSFLLSNINETLYNISNLSDGESIHVIENPSNLSIVKSYEKNRKKRDDVKKWLHSVHYDSRLHNYYLSQIHWTSPYKIDL